MSEESNKVISINTASSEGNSKKTTRGATDGRACTACKYQRRRCAPNCVLAPYFPPENPQHSMNAHKLFGLKKLKKHLNNVLPHQKETTMKTLIFEANARARDPVGGCQRIVVELLKRIEFFTAELELLKQHLAWCRAQALENEIQRFNTPMGTYNTAAANGEENRNSSFDESLKFYNSTYAPPRFGYDGHHDAAFDNIPHRSEDVGALVLGSYSDKVVVPRVEAEADNNYAHQVTDLKNAASTFTMSNWWT